MRDKYQKIETTFGQIRIFKDSTENDDPINQPEQLKSKINSDIRQEAKSENDSDSDNNGNFFGIDTKTVNYFDKQLVDQYNGNKETSPPTEQISSNNTEKLELNFVDEFYFKNLSPEQTTEKKSIQEFDIKTDDIEKLAKDMNFIDENVFNSSNNQNQIDKNPKQNDDLFGSIQNFKKRQTKIKTDNTTIPIVQSKNLKDDDSINQKLNFKSSEMNKSIEDSVSQHKLLQSEVPNWTNFTLDEAVNILKTHICYNNEERKNFLIV